MTPDTTPLLERRDEGRTPPSLDSLVGELVVVSILQYEVREGGEAGEVVVLPKAFIANCNSSFILLEVPNAAF